MLPVPRKALSRQLYESLPRTGDVVRLTYGVGESEGRPVRLVADEDEAIPSDGVDYRLHSLTVRLYPRHVRIVPLTPRQCRPHDGIELEIPALPFVAHRGEDEPDVIEGVRMGTIKHIPGAPSPAAERVSVGRERGAVRVGNEPIGVFAEEARILFGDERRDPDGRDESPVCDHPAQLPDPPGESRIGLQPVPHERLISVVDLHVGESQRTIRNRFKIVDHVPLGDLRPVAVPRTPSGGRFIPRQPRVSQRQLIGKHREQLLPVSPFQREEILEYPCLSGSEDLPFGVQHDLERISGKPDFGGEPPARGERPEDMASPCGGEQREVVDGGESGLLRKAVVSRVGILPDRLDRREHACVLGQHVVPLSIHLGIGGERHPSGEEGDLNDSDRLRSPVRETGRRGSAHPLPLERQHSRCAGIGCPDFVSGIPEYRIRRHRSPSMSWHISWFAEIRLVP